MAARVKSKIVLLSALLLVSRGVWADGPFDAGVDAYGKGDFVAARQDWEAALAQGDWEAARNLGLLYRKGLGVAKDDAKAVAYYQQASDHGVANAKLNLAELYLAGEGVPKDEDKAKQLLKDAADQGSFPARFRLEELQDEEARGGRSLALTAPSRSLSDSLNVKAQPVETVQPEPKKAAPSVVKADALPTAAAPVPKAVAETAKQPVAPAPAEKPKPAAGPVVAAVVAAPAPPPPVPARKPSTPAPALAQTAPLAAVPASKEPVPKEAAPKEAVPETAPKPNPAPPPPAAAGDDVIAIDPVKAELKPGAEAGQLRLHVASYRNDADAAQGWLNYNLPGLMPELEAVQIPGKGRFIRLYAVGPAETMRQLCDDMNARGEQCLSPGAPPSSSPGRSPADKS